MPGNIANAVPSGVLPQSLCTAFSEVRAYAQLSNLYHDGSTQRSQLSQTSRRIFRQNKRLNAAALTTLYNFWVAQNGGLTPFAYYNPFEPAAGEQIGSNYDPTGASTQGRYIVVFRNAAWSQETDVARSNVQDIELIEVE